MKLLEVLQHNPVKMWREGHPHSTLIVGDRSTAVYLEDLLADDWLFEERKVEISLTQLRELVNKHIAVDFCVNDKFSKMVKEIGL